MTSFNGDNKNEHYGQYIPFEEKLPARNFNLRIHREDYLANKAAGDYWQKGLIHNRLSAAIQTKMMRWNKLFKYEIIQIKISINT